MRLLKHLSEVVILGQFVSCLVKEAIIDGDVTVTIGPHQRHQIDPAHDSMMLARPVAADQLDLTGREMVQRRIVKDQEAIIERHFGLSLVPQGLRVWLQAMEQAGKGIVRGWVNAVGLDARRFQGAESARRRC